MNDLFESWAISVNSRDFTVPHGHFSCKAVDLQPGDIYYVPEVPQPVPNFVIAIWGDNLMIICSDVGVFTIPLHVMSDVVVASRVQG